jgi:electron transfer flavoprotein alpha subunit
VLALIIVRDGELPGGASETVAECGGRALLAGTCLDVAVGELEGVAVTVRLAETAVTAPDLLAPMLGDVIGDEPMVVLPASPDGRDLAPHLALLREQPLYAGALAVSPDRVVLVRGGHCAWLAPPPSFVATLQPGTRSVIADRSTPSIERLTTAAAEREPGSGAVTTEAVLPPDASTIDLAESPRILGGGAGLDGAERFDQLASVAAALDASVGATRVITDRGWVPHERQIGTTGVVVDPSLYIAFGISGAVQHTSGLGDPDHIISVNTDPHCPMMQLADVAIVSDANAVIEALDRRLATATATTAGGTSAP